MHGDNSGSASLLPIGDNYRNFEMDSEQPMVSFAEGLKTRMNQVCWNGSFYAILLKKPRRNRGRR